MQTGRMKTKYNRKRKKEKREEMRMKGEQEGKIERRSKSSLAAGPDSGPQ